MANSKFLIAKLVIKVVDLKRKIVTSTIHAAIKRRFVVVDCLTNLGSVTAILVSLAHIRTVGFEPTNTRLPDGDYTKPSSALWSAQPPSRTTNAVGAPAR